MNSEYFPFGAARITAQDTDGEALPGAVLDLPTHGLAEFLPDPESHGGERFIIRFALTELPQLPAASTAASHDLLLWDAAPALPLRGHREVWLHRVTLHPSATGPGWVSLSGPAWGRSLHLERQPPVPFDTTARPDWGLQTPTSTTTGN
jgi:hypothetical protein